MKRVTERVRRLPSDHCESADVASGRSLGRGESDDDLPSGLPQLAIDFGGNLGKERVDIDGGDCQPFFSSGPHQGEKKAKKQPSTRQTLDEDVTHG